MSLFKNEKALIAPSIYLVFALLIWNGFAHSYASVGAQALQNVGLVFAVLPLALIDIAVLVVFGGDAILNWSNLLHKIGFPNGYLLDHAYYYFPRVVAIAWIIFWLGTLSKRKDAL